MGLFYANSSHVRESQMNNSKGVSGENMKNYYNRGRGKMFPRPRLMCQVCNKARHTALQCYHRFDITMFEALVKMVQNFTAGRERLITGDE